MRKFVAFLILSLMAIALPVSVDAQLPSVTVKDLKGRSVDTATLGNDGNPFVISFFATWCKPCLRELKAIAEVYPDWQDETGMKMYIVSIDDAQNTNKVKPLVDSFGWEYDVLLDANSDFLRALGIQNVPHLLICNGNGDIVESHSGYTDGSEGEIIKTIREIQAKK